MKKIQAVLFVFVINFSIHAQVSLYTSPNYNGKKISLKEGNYKLLPNGFYNQLQSLKIAEGYFVELFSLPMYRGKKVVLFYDSPSFPENWGNKTGSVKIFIKNEKISDSITALNPWENMQEIDPNSFMAKFPVNYNDTGNVILYSECNYLGKKNEINTGSYKSIAAWSISSIKIPGDKKIIIYTLPNYKGSSTSYNSDENCLLSGWNNKIGSIKVIDNTLAGMLSDTSIGLGGFGIKGTGSGGGGYGGGGSIGSGGGNWGYGKPNSGTGVNVVIYDKCNYTGQNRSLGVGEYPAIPSATTLKISSIRIPAGKKAEVFTGKNYTGKSAILTTSQNCLPANWNDKIQSIKISSH